MFDLSVGKLLVLLIIGILVVGPDRLPTLAKDAARLLHALRELATGAREQLHNELGPEFADLDIQSLNPRTVIQRAVFADDLDPAHVDPRTAFRNAILGDGHPNGPTPRTETSDPSPQAQPSTVAPTHTPPHRSQPRPGPGKTPKQ